MAEQAFRPEEEGRGLVLQSSSEEAFLYVLSPIRDSVALANLHLPSWEERTRSRHLLSALVPSRVTRKSERIPDVKLRPWACHRRHRFAFCGEAVVGKSTIPMELLGDSFGAKA